MRKNDIIATLALRSIKGIGPAAIKSFWQKGSFRNENCYRTIENVVRTLKDPISDNEIEDLVTRAEEIISSSSNENIHILHLSEPEYPAQLAQLNAPPSVLFYKGNLSALNSVIGIIGTRDPDSVGLEVAKRIAAYFHSQGFSICNGLALGIDEGSIKTENGILQNVVGVLAGGLNYNQSKTLLKSTARLAEQVLEAGGLLISEFENNVKEDTFKVIKSCKLQAGLSHGLILVQSKLNGGSKYTLEAFCSLNRPLGVIDLPSKQDDPLYEANQAIAKDFRAGLSKMVGLKPNNIKLDRVDLLASKSDYPLFESRVRSKQSMQDSLF